MTVGTILAQATAAWASAYSNHAALRVAVTFCHFAGLMAGGGLAVAADRTTLRLAGGTAEARRAHLDELHTIHQVVVGGLLLTIVSGVLMVGADLETMAASKIFWTKMALVALLMANGLGMRRAERAIRTSPVAWPRLHRAAVVSLALWFAIVLAGTLLALEA